MTSPKVLIFIDTNIYLRFYNSKQGDYKKLLESIVELNQYLFITNQIIDEIERNKQKLFKDSFDGYIDQVNTIKIELPNHLTADTDKKIKEWNNERKGIEGASIKSRDELKQISSELLVQILKGEDEVSKILQKLYGNSEEVTDEIYAIAKKRKDLGNPPGKRTDPLGDQINWELLLAYLEHNTVEDLIIVSSDKDYFIDNYGELQLNSFLYQELIKSNEKISIWCYQSLAVALEKFSEIQKLKNLPSSEELKKIKEEEYQSIQEDYERRQNESLIRGSNIYGIGYSGYSNWPIHNSIRICPRCHNLSLKESPTIKLIGGHTYREYQCSVCDFKQDI